MLIWLCIDTAERACLEEYKDNRIQRSVSKFLLYNTYILFIFYHLLQTIFYNYDCL